MKACVGMMLLMIVGLGLCGCGSGTSEEDVEAITDKKLGFKEYEKELAEKEGVDGLASLLRSDSTKVRMSAITALGYFKDDEKATRLLLDVVEKPRDSNDAYFAVLSLARQGAPQTKKVIERFYSGDNAYLREAAVQAIGLLGDKSLYPLVIKALEDPDSTVQKNAQYVIEKYNIQEALQE